MKRLVLLSLLLTGCSSVYTPRAPTVAQITTSSYDTLIAQYDAIPDGTPAKVTAKNRIILRAKLAIDTNYLGFEQSFLTGQAYIQTGGEIATLGLSEAAGVTSLGTSHLLSVIAGGITGANAIYQKNFFANATRWVIIQQMRADRANQEILISQDMDPASRGTLEQDIVDLVTYYQAGSVVDALQNIAGNSGTQAQTARQALKMMRK